VINIVAYSLKASTEEPEKMLLLANGSTFLSRQRLGKHVPAATDTHATIEVLLETAFSIRSVQTGYKEVNGGNRVSFVREAPKKRDRRKEAVGREPPFREDLSPEADE
jgi:hypothetical protein